MSEPVPTRGKPVAAVKPVSPAEVPPGSSVSCQLQVSYYRRMRLQRVYPISVSSRLSAGTRLVPTFLQIRLVIPGALVTPAERELDAGDPKAQVTFHMTPLARGRLPQPHLEVLRGETVLQRVPLRMRVVSNRLTWILAGLTVLVPAFLLYVTRYAPLRGTISINPGVRVPAVQPAPAPPPIRVNPPADAPPPITRSPQEAVTLQLVIGLVDNSPAKSEKQDSNKEQDKKPDPPKDAAKNPSELPKDKSPLKKDEQPQFRGGGIIKDELPPPPKGATLERPATPGEVLEREIVRNVPEIPADWLEKNPWMPRITQPLAKALGSCYDFAVNLALDYLSFWVGVALLCLTLISAILHRSVRGRRYSDPIPL